MGESPVRPGEVLGHKYRVDKVLGVGGMGVVVAATHLQLDQRVALKFMLANAHADHDAIQRFQREARAAVKLRSEHVARVLDTGTFDDATPYIVMEFLEGNDLADEIKRARESARALPLAVVAEWVIQACDAIAEAHSIGIVHRDLKPANLFLTRRNDHTPLVKVLDFGISKMNALSEGALAMTSTTAVMGSPLYMSPEQMKATKSADSQSDVWSLGVILYELLSGDVPFNSESLGGLFSKVMMDAHVPLTGVRPDLPQDVATMVDRCLEKHRTRRVQSVTEIVRVLAPHAPARAQVIVDRITTTFAASESARPTHAATVASTQIAAPAVPASFGALAAQTARGWGATAAGPQAVQQPTKSRARAWVAVLSLVIVGSVGVAIAFKLRASRPDPATARYSIDSPVAGDASTSAPVASETAATSDVIRLGAPTTQPPTPLTLEPNASVKSGTTHGGPNGRGSKTPMKPRPVAVSASTPSVTPSSTTPTIPTAPVTLPVTPPRPAPSSPTPDQKPGILDTSN